MAKIHVELYKNRRFPLIFLLRFHKFASVGGGAPRPNPLQMLLSKFSKFLSKFSTNFVKIFKNFEKIAKFS